MLAVDTETTGIDLHHGAKPFFITLCDESGQQEYWEWDVNPLTREPEIPSEHLSEVKKRIWGADLLVLQNAKFDVAALRTICPDLATRWDWKRTRDTLLAGHLLYSNKPHDLTSMTLQYLGKDIQIFEDKLEDAVQECRRWCRRHKPDWRIASEGLKEMPSARQKTWKYDCWLPRAVAKQRFQDGEREFNPDLYPDKLHPYWSVLREYANTDSAATMLLWQEMEPEIHARQLWRIYEERLKVLPIAYRMEMTGVTVNLMAMKELREEFSRRSAYSNAVCTNVAANSGCTVTLPKSGNNSSLISYLTAVVEKQSEEFFQSFPRTDNGNLSFNAAALEKLYLATPPRSRERKFLEHLLKKRKLDTQVSYIDGYLRHMRMMDPADLTNHWGWLWPSLNPTGTDTLRWSSSNPNSQNISKKDGPEDKGVNLRVPFGPAPGREWWSFDGENLELRLPAYEAGEEEMIALFERPNDPPHYGSNHSLVCSILYPKEFEECVRDGVTFKERYKNTLYQWVKNGNFAVQYGAMEASGTADRAYHYPGAQRLIQSRFSRIKQLNERQIDFANRHGYVETIPDRSVDPERGYPLLCSRTEYGQILPTVPLNYHIQGTACWWMMRAMIRVQEQLDKWREGTNGEFDGFITLQIHDELVLDFPISRGDPSDDVDKGREKGVRLFCISNLWRAKVIQRLMAQSGDDIGIPTPVSCEYHPKTWAEGIKF